MDDLAGNLHFEKIEPPKDLFLEKNKRRKRSKSADDEVAIESSSPSVKKLKIHKTESAIRQEDICILSRKQQNKQFSEFCSEYVFQDSGDAPGISYKKFAKCNLPEISETTTVLSQFLIDFFSNWNQDRTELTQKGSPLLLLISSSAVRALEMARDARQALGEDSTIAKLFAKHMKINKQQEFLTAHVCHIATGTPERLLQLINKFDYLSTSLKLVVLDWQRKDAKQRTLIEIPENKKPLATLLREFIIPFLFSCHTKMFLL